MITSETIRASISVITPNDVREVKALLGASGYRSLEQLGRLAYAEQTGRPASDADAAGAKLIEELRTLESQGVDVLAAAPPATDPPGA
jgi:hypothetical protein